MQSRRAPGLHDVERARGETCAYRAISGRYALCGDRITGDGMPPTLPGSPLARELRKARGMSHRGGFFGKPLRNISRFRHQDAQTPPSPLVGEGGRGDEGQKARECSTPRIAPKNAPLRGEYSSPSARIRHSGADPWSIPALKGKARLRGLARAVGLKPSAMQDEARLRGLWRNNYSKTIISVYTLLTACASSGTVDTDNGHYI